ncbi:hypothetical protein SKAU_G00335810 [Synaphobranchus kaupii]|uniref:Uncharacterized protein n=1 Tax=Synaphobranchus kaupii TaxID=118154 RepID=A0A9Q1EM70_SYNKA|nr:hypothetical protein SKAU_G00335810 [Synaphobranchus kaupii]
MNDICTNGKSIQVCQKLFLALGSIRWRTEPRLKPFENTNGSVDVFPCVPLPALILVAELRAGLITAPFFIHPPPTGCQQPPGQRLAPVPSRQTTEKPDARRRSGCRACRPLVKTADRPGDMSAKPGAKTARFRTSPRAYLNLAKSYASRGRTPPRAAGPGRGERPGAPGRARVPAPRRRKRRGAGEERTDLRIPWLNDAAAVLHTKEHAGGGVPPVCELRWEGPPSLRHWLIRRCAGDGCQRVERGAGLSLAHAHCAPLSGV